MSKHKSPLDTASAAAPTAYINRPTDLAVSPRCGFTEFEVEAVSDAGKAFFREHVFGATSCRISGTEFAQMMETAFAEGLIARSG